MTVQYSIFTYKILLDKIGQPELEDGRGGESVRRSHLLQLAGRLNGIGHVTADLLVMTWKRDGTVQAGRKTSATTQLYKGILVLMKRRGTLGQQPSIHKEESS